MERLFRRIVANLSALDPGAVHRPVPVGDIADRLVPYRTHRSALGLDSHEDYEIAVLRLLAGEGGFAQVFPDDVATLLMRESASVNPDPGMFRNFPDATFLLDADRVADLVGAPARQPPTAHVAPAPALAEPEQADDVEPEPEPPVDEDLDAAEPLPFSLDEDPDSIPVASQPRAIGAGVACSYCGGNLPVGRTVLFCPHCGQNIGVVHCPTCGSELDVGWTFCITCGQKVTGIG